MWTSLLEAKLSIVVRRRGGDIIGACLNFDARADEAAPLCACSAFSRNLADIEEKEEEEEDTEEEIIKENEGIHVEEGKKGIAK